MVCLANASRLYGKRCAPYCSPIFVREVVPKKTGKGILYLRFFNAFYAEGVREFTCELCVIKRASNYLITEIINGGSDAEERCAVVSCIEFGWVRKLCPELWRAKPPERCSRDAQQSISNYLKEVFGKV